MGEPEVPPSLVNEPIELDEDALTPVVRAAIRSRDAALIDWEVQPLGFTDVHFGAGKLFLVTGTAGDRGSSRAWSVVLKPVAREDDARAMDPSEAPDDYAYWKREPLAFASGILDRLPGGLAAPTCFGVTERRPDLFWIWLEHLPDNHVWPLERYRNAARHLGAFNGAYLAGTPTPAVGWLASTKSVQSYWGASHPFMDTAIEFLHTRAMWRSDEIRRALDPLNLEALAAFFADQDRYVEKLESMPQTFCHNDALRPNLFAGRGPGGADRTIAVDWQVAGHGPIGGELAMLVAGSVLFLKVAAADIEELAALAWGGYMTGLDDAGCRVDERTVRFGFAASIALRCGLLAAIWLRNALEDPVLVEQIWSRPASEVLAQNALLAGYLDQRAAEARELLTDA